MMQVGSEPRRGRSRSSYAREVDAIAASAMNSTVGQSGRFFPAHDLVLIQLMEARDLLPSEFFARPCDPYCILVLGNQSAKSRQIARNCNPVFNELFGFRCSATVWFRAPNLWCVCISQHPVHATIRMRGCCGCLSATGKRRHSTPTSVILVCL
jgi:hypothetical protein